MTDPKSGSNGPSCLLVFLITVMTIDALIGLYFAWKFQKELGETRIQLIQTQSELDRAKLEMEVFLPQSQHRMHCAVSSWKQMP
ncbi:MAG: hypothetical protein ACI97A_004265 [Planctomycetota bacterium]|jgi:hypothetical protein